ncbi:hypothetical protein NKG05_15830 [Oerskovia sp. M15]
MVRSTHGVNCTGSCSWKVYVKDGIITWETQQTDYPSVGPDSPEYEPRVVRAARPSAGTPTPRPACAIRTSAACCCGRSARPRPARGPGAGVGRGHGKPGDGACVQAGTRQGRPGPGVVGGGRGDRRGGPRPHHQDLRAGPHRGLLPIPAMSMVSHGVGSRFISMLGGAMLSFYDWYADLPVASPQVFGDQTDVRSRPTGGTPRTASCGARTSR